MKTKLFYLTTVILSFFLSCTQLDFDEDFAVQPNPKVEPNPKFNVGLASVNALVEILNKDESGALRKEVKEIKPIVHNLDTLLYLVNYTDNNGWIVISGDKRTSSILAYADEGLLKLDLLNPGQAIWLDDLAQQIYVLKNHTNVEPDTLSPDYVLWDRIEAYLNHTANPQYLPPIPLDPPGHWVLMGITSQTITPTQVGPLVQTKWGQGFPWNTCVPTYYDTMDRCPTGCVAVAGAQMLYYLHYHFGVPATMYSSGSCTGFVYDSDNHSYHFSFAGRNTATWDLMATQIIAYYDVNGNAYIISNANTERVAILMGHIGSQVGMEYGEQSGADTQNLVSLFSNEGINCNYTGYNSSAIVSSLNNNVPVIVSAYANRNNHTFLGLFDMYYTYHNGHAWIIDGYENKRIQYTYHYEWVYEPQNPPVPVPYIDPKTEEYISTTPEFFIMNWGWDGGHDSGRYAMASDSIWSVSGIDSNGNLVTRNYQYLKEMIYNFTVK
jgi:hypothetical protein